MIKAGSINERDTENKGEWEKKKQENTHLLLVI